MSAIPSLRTLCMREIAESKLNGEEIVGLPEDLMDEVAEVSQMKHELDVHMLWASVFPLTLKHDKKLEEIKIQVTSHHSCWRPNAFDIYKLDTKLFDESLWDKDPGALCRKAVWLDPTKTFSQQGIKFGASFTVLAAGKVKTPDGEEFYVCFDSIGGGR